MVKRLPFAGGAEPRMRAPSSSSLNIRVGLASVDQISVEEILSLGNLWLVALPSIQITGLPLTSWPVTTRRKFGAARSI
jgi:hypothetical protein